jgi:Concanavalin A-like lectin/glucanases superfamily
MGSYNRGMRGALVGALAALVGCGGLIAAEPDGGAAADDAATRPSDASTSSDASWRRDAWGDRDARPKRDALAEGDAWTPDVDGVSASDATTTSIDVDVPPEASAEASTDAGSDGPASCITEAHPVGYWRFTDCSSTNATIEDWSGNGFEGTRNAAVSCAAGRSGLAGSFDGLTGEVDIADEQAFHMTTAVTIAAWVNPTEIGGLQTILNKWYAPDSYMLLIQNGEFQFTVALPGGQWGVDTVASAPAVSGVWTHLAGVYDGATLWLYVNGALAGQASAAPAGTTVALQQSTRPLCIGNCPSWNAFSGLIQDVWLGDAVLTQAQIQQLAFGCGGTDASVDGD